MTPYLRIVRPINLLLLILVQFVIKYGFLEPLEVKTSLDSLGFSLLVIATLCIAAAGNVINDIFDKEIDLVNKPNKVLVGKRISEKKAYNYYMLLNVVGVGAGFYLSNLLDKPAMAAIFIIISALLYVYSSQLKTMLIIGNVLVSVLVATSLIVIILFDIFPALDPDNLDLQVRASRLILLYAGFAFYINLLREIVKDLQDINGDKKGGGNTLPIAIGRSRTVQVVFILGVIGLLGILFYTYTHLYRFRNAAFYFVFLVAAPLLFFCIKAWDAEKDKHYKLLSILLKLIMLSGILSILFYPSILD